ncbi:MAG: exodeoxyribonuclease VII large subunit [Phycisphaerales bacterium]|nr:exodeoxyribonuclease VII large subunit [Phycisphaerales bacterium]
MDLPPLFDPKRIQVPEGERSAAARRDTGEQLLSPEQVNELVRGAVVKHLPATVHVVGEIGDFSRATSGHLYFTLKDRVSELRCVMWRSAATKVKFTPSVGMEVVATGAVEVYVPRGAYQLIARRLEPRGVGSLELAFRQLREKLEKEGLFDAARKRPLPALPRRIAIVTSPTGAAVRDIIQTLRRRYRLAELVLFPVRVQGEGAAAEIAAAIGAMNRHAATLGGIDVAIVGRGGGSLEDLWAFNEEAVARAIAASAIPIVSAVGHEVDFTIADFVADVRAATPTAAAELVAPSSADLLDRLGRDRRRLDRAVLLTLERSRGRYRAVTAAECLSRPARRLSDLALALDELTQRVTTSVQGRLVDFRSRLARTHGCIREFGAGAAVSQIARRLDRLSARLLERVQVQLGAGGRRIRRAELRLQAAGPGMQLARLAERLVAARRRLPAALARFVAHARERLVARQQRIEAANPRSILRRGFSITRDAKTGAVLRTILGLREGQRVRVELADGEFAARAEDPRQGRLFGGDGPNAE